MHYAHDDNLAVHRLAHGQVAHLRPLRRGETNLVQQVFDVMSDDSRFFRFHAATPRLTQSRLTYLAEVEHRSHVAVVALVDGEAVGIARWLRLRHDPDTAELAAAVGDDFQRQGLGRALATYAAASAAVAGITHFLCSVHSAHWRLITTLRKLGARRLAEDATTFVLPVAAVLERAAAPGRGRGSISTCSTACSAPCRCSATAVT